MNYNREFLVPYLEDICALYIARQKLEQMRAAYDSEIRTIQGGTRETIPPKLPPYVNDSIWDRPFSLICGTFFGVIPLLCLIFGGFDGMSDGLAAASVLLLFPAIIGGLYLLWSVFSEAKSGKEYNKSLDAAYIQNKQLAEENKKQNEHDRLLKIPPLRNKRDECQEEIRTINELLTQAYNVNIIPSRYRDFYTAIYLYDFFSTGRSTDLEAALGLYVLEQIKERLDRIIRNQSEMILNQRIMLAKQQESINLQKEHFYMVKSKLDKLISNDEDKKMYLGMIESNTATTAYFATADYFID